MAERFKTFGPDAEVLGQVMLSFMECSNREHVLPYLEKHGLKEIDPDRWYPQQLWLDIVHDLAEAYKGDAMFDFVSIGMKVIETAYFPPDFAKLSLLEVLSGWNDFYHMNNRGKDCGEVRIEAISPTHIKTISHVPYPDDLHYGVFYGIVERFMHGKDYTVFYDDVAPRPDFGGKNLIIHVEWK